MKRHYILGICLVICAQSLWAQDTFSIVAVDPATGEVGSAGATCVEGIGALGGVILLSGIVPNYKMTLETPNNAGVYRLVLRDQQGNVLHQESVVVTN